MLDTKANTYTEHAHRSPSSIPPRTTYYPHYYLFYFFHLLIRLQGLLPAEIKGIMKELFNLLLVHVLVTSGDRAGG